jgi:two-component system response regulator YesN
LGILIEAGQKSQYFATLKPVLQLLSQSDIKQSAPVQEIYLQLSIQMLNYINRYNLTDKLAAVESLTQLGNVNEFTSGEEAAKYITRLSETIFGLQENMQRERSSDSISIIKQYVENHTTQDLSLVKLASLVSFNPSYLSRLFKQTTGENLSDYVVREKLKKALYLLENTELSIKEVSSQMGFYTPTYFAKFFKRLTGVNPQKYRESRMKSADVFGQVDSLRSDHD